MILLGREKYKQKWIILQSTVCKKNADHGYGMPNCSLSRVVL